MKKEEPLLTREALEELPEFIWVPYIPEVHEGAEPDEDGYVKKRLSEAPASDIFGGARTLEGDMWSTMRRHYALHVLGRFVKTKDISRDTPVHEVLTMARGHLQEYAKAQPEPAICPDCVTPGGG